jgi:hypothetical protein
VTTSAHNLCIEEEATARVMICDAAKGGDEEAYYD